MPTSPSSVVKGAGPLNSCAPELSRISVRHALVLLGQGPRRRRCLDGVRQRPLGEHDAAGPGAGLLGVERPAVGGRERHAPADLDRAAGGHRAIGRDEAVDQREADGDERGDQRHDDGSRPAPAVQPQEPAGNTAGHDRLAHRPVTLGVRCGGRATRAGPASPPAPVPGTSTRFSRLTTRRGRPRCRSRRRRCWRIWPRRCAQASARASRTSDAVGLGGQVVRVRQATGVEPVVQRAGAARCARPRPSAHEAGARPSSSTDVEPVRRVLQDPVVAGLVPGPDGRRGSRP